MLIGVLTVFHIVVCLFLIIVVLLQTGKRADLAGAFGGGGSQTAFGARGAATLLSKATTGAAVVFMLTSLTLAILSSRSRSGSTVLDSVPAPAQQSAPASPEAPPPGQQPAPAAPGTPTPAPAQPDSPGGLPPDVPAN